jgi:hypothetical protein
MGHQMKGQQIAQDRRADRDDQGDLERVADDGEIERVLERARVIGEREILDDRVILDAPEAEPEDFGVRQKDEYQ